MSLGPQEIILDPLGHLTPEQRATLKPSDRWATIRKNPHLLAIICSEIAAGGTAAKLAAAWSVQYPHFHAWINATQERKTALAAAVAEREDWAKETILGVLQSIATSTTAKDADRVRAAEVWGRKFAMWTDKSEHGLGIGLLQVLAGIDPVKLLGAPMKPSDPMPPPELAVVRVPAELTEPVL